MKIPKPFDSTDIEDLKHTIRVTHDVSKGIFREHKGHFGLGLRTALLLGMTYGEGSVLQVGELGVGKSVIMEGIERRVDHDGMYVWNQEQTMAGSDEEFNEFFSHHRVLWVSDDLAKLTPEVQKGMLKVVGSISQGGNCKVKTSLYYCNVEACKLAWLSACVFELYDRIWQIPEFRGSQKDRILRLFCFDYGETGVNKKPIIIRDFNPKIDLNRRPKVKKGKGFRKIVDMLSWQFSDKRAVDYAERYLKGLAIMNNRDEVTEADYKFLELFRFNIEAEKWVGWREHETAPIIIDSRALYDFHMALKSNGIKISTLATRRLTEEEKIRETIENNPEIFDLKRMGQVLYPKKEIVERYFKPQRNFEMYCYWRKTD